MLTEWQLRRLNYIKTLNFTQRLNFQKHPISRPHGWSMMRLLCKFYMNIMNFNVQNLKDMYFRYFWYRMKLSFHINISSKHIPSLYLKNLTGKEIESP